MTCFKFHELMKLVKVTEKFIRKIKLDDSKIRLG